MTHQLVCFYISLWLNKFPLHTRYPFTGILWMVATFLIPKPKMYFIPIHKHPFYLHIKEHLAKLQNQELTQDSIISTLSLFKIMTTKESQDKIDQYLENKKRQQGNPILRFVKSIRLIKKLISIFSKQKEKNEMLTELEASSIRNREPYQVLIESKSKYSILKIFGKVAGFILECEEFSEIEKIPIFLSGDCLPHVLTQRQVLYVLCLMTLNLVPIQHYHKSNLSKKFNYTNNFSLIFNKQPYKAQVILEFLKLMLDRDQGFFFLKKIDLSQRFLIKREALDRSIESIIESNSSKKMGQFQILKDDDSIEEYYGESKVNFANKYIGGGALRTGCVQEEIMFANHPELYAAILLCQSLKQNESLRYEGFRKYFKNHGYSYQTSFAGHQILNKKKEVIIAIDALDFSKNENQQYTKESIDRQILKAYAGFKNNFTKSVVTGNWGCGVFKGHLKLKFMIQWIAASLAGKQLRYCPYGKRYELNAESNLSEEISKLEMGEVYKKLILASYRWMSQKRKYYQSSFMEIFYNEVKEAIREKQGISMKKDHFAC